jgi:pimeloyl-ACP methyl ester carboxylesterase
MTLRVLTGPAGSLAVDDGGRGGLPVVFLHSLAGNSTHWSRQLDRLRPSRRAVALDFRGHGDSEPARDGDYTIAALSGDVETVLTGIGIDRYALVGHSMGGSVALAQAARDPDRVAGLLLVDPNGDPRQYPADEIRAFLAALDSPAYPSVIREFWTGIGGPNPPVRDRLLADLARTARETVIGALTAVMAFDPTPALAGWTGPTLSLVTPSNDGPGSLHRLGAGFPHRVISGTGHWIHLDRPDEFDRLLDEFLAELPPGRAERSRTGSPAGSGGAEPVT